MCDPITAIVGGGIVSGLLGSDAADSAAQAQVQAGQDSNATQLAMFNQNRSDLAPWRQAGVNALTQLNAGAQPGGNLLRPFSMSDFQADPGYNFRLKEGMRALEQSAAARGGLLSGNMLKGISRYGQDSASQEYGNAYNRYNQDKSNQFNRLAALSGIGQTSAQQVANLGTSTAQGIANTQQGIGNARASGYVGGANALTGGLSSAYNNYQGQQILNRLMPAAGGYGGGGYSSGSSSYYGASGDPYGMI